MADWRGRRGERIREVLPVNKRIRTESKRQFPRAIIWANALVYLLSGWRGGFPKFRFGVAKFGGWGANGYEN
jgi:hypothetical protein